MSIGISVVITTWNRQNLLERALNSIRDARKVCPIEIIVVDDASKIPASVSMFQDLNVRLLRHSENKGECSARNTGIDSASYNWVAILDDDDEFLPRVFEVFFKYMQDPNWNQEPALFFSYAGNLEKYKIHRYFIESYVRDVQGEFLTFINKSIWLKEKMEYPRLLMVGPSLIWMKLAASYGVVIIDDMVAKINHDSQHRICSSKYQLEHASSFVDFYREWIELVETSSSQLYEFYKKKVFGYALFSVFSSRKLESIQFLRTLELDFVTILGCFCFFCFPRPFLKVGFRAYRKLVSGI